MTDNAKLRDERFWRRLGLELVAAQAMLPQIACEYWDVLDDKSTRKLVRACEQLLDLREAMQAKMRQYIPDSSEKVFYPGDCAELLASCEAFLCEVRNTVKMEEVIEKCTNTTANGPTS